MPALTIDATGLFRKHANRDALDGDVGDGAHPALLAHARPASSASFRDGYGKMQGPELEIARVNKPALPWLAR